MDPLSPPPIFKRLQILFPFHASSSVCDRLFFFFFSYPPSCGITPCVGTVGTVHMMPTLEVALLYVVHHDGVTTTSFRAGTDLGRFSDVDL